MCPRNVLAQEQTNLPGWIGEKPSFTEEIRQTFFQSRVVFYPGGGRDGHPIKLFCSSRAAFCFVYADQDGYDCGEEPVGYKSVRDDEVPWPHRDRSFRFTGTEPRAARWIIFQRQEGYGPDHGHEFIAVLYVHGEAFTVYWDLWAVNGKAPYAIVLVDHSFGGNFTGHRFGGDQSPMCQWASEQNAWPDWLLVSELTTPWPGYQRASDGDPGGMHGDNRFLHRRQPPMISRSTRNA